MFGNHGEGTWEWTGKTWSQLASGGPSFASRLVYDEGRGVLVLVGANDYDNGRNRETWELVGNAWQLVHRVDKFQALGQGAVYDSNLRRVLTFGVSIPSPLPTAKRLGTAARGE